MLPIGFSKEIEMLRYFCVIPARGGSKRIPRKNIQEVAGIPLIGHVIKNVSASGVFEAVFVSTDDTEIANIAEGFGAIVPYLRDPNLSNDFTPTRPVIAEFISKNSLLQNDDTVIACVYPFAIFIEPSIFHSAVQKFERIQDTSRFLVAIQRYSHPVQRALTLNSDSVLSPVSPMHLEHRTQDLQQTYHDAGQFYFAKKDTWLCEGSILSNSYGFELDKYTTVDVDTVDDLSELKRRFANQHSQK